MSWRAAATVGAVTLTVFTVTVLVLAAAADAWLHDGATTLVALTAVWIPQTLIFARRRTTTRTPTT